MSSLAEEGKRAGVTDKRRISSMAAECKWVGVTGTLLGLGTNVQKGSTPHPTPPGPSVMSIASPTVHMGSRRLWPGPQGELNLLFLD